ncbi:MAG: DUF4105 domain-containing protein [Marinicaulis sp.]|nr:DUF4105 domain-containing protein [Marinicaulis sp.]NNL87782.1 DUF4105 domain-containing protein [Marinicaulis sp.]
MSLRMMIIAGISVFIGIAILAVLLRTPRNDRPWIDALARPPEFVKGADTLWSIRNFRAFVFDKDGETEKAWREELIDAEDLAEVWFFIEPFEKWDSAAHSFLSFVFEGEHAKTISVSVEARREVGETYSGLKGIFNKYELIYIWSTEKDILTRIAVDLDHDLYAYRLNVTPEQAQAILMHFINRTNTLAERPRFYNTLVSNCTNELAKAVNAAFPGALPWHFAHVLTGHSAERLHELGFLSPEATVFEGIKANANIRSIVQDVKALPENEFDDAWRAHLAPKIRPHEKINGTSRG